MEIDIAIFQELKNFRKGGFPNGNGKLWIFVWENFNISNGIYLSVVLTTVFVMFFISLFII